MRWFYSEDQFYYIVSPEKWTEESVKNFVESSRKEVEDFLKSKNRSREEIESALSCISVGDERIEKIGSVINPIASWVEINKPVFLKAPTEGEIERVLAENREKKVAVIAPYPIPEKWKNVFVFQELPNLFGSFTSQQMERICMSPEREREKIKRKILQEKLGLNVYKPNLDLDRLVGMVNVKRYIMSVKTIKTKYLRPKGVFLVGIPGTGKSYSAKVAASALGWYLVELNISKILESSNPVFALHSSFSYLEELDRKVREAEGENVGFVLWIDEIEKMFSGGTDSEKRVFGQLLTILNDLNTDTGYKIRGVFWVTANKIDRIAEENPEFLRKGRFDQLFFVDTPGEEDAKELFRLYRRVYKFSYNPIFRLKEVGINTFEDEAVSLVKENIYREDVKAFGSESVDRFIYTPSEIQQVCKELAIRQRQKLQLLSVYKKLKSAREAYYTSSSEKEKKILQENIKEYEKQFNNLVKFIYNKETLRLAFEKEPLFYKYYVLRKDGHVSGEEEAEAKNRASSDALFSEIYDKAVEGILERALESLRFTKKDKIENEYTEHKRKRAVLDTLDLFFTLVEVQPISAVLKDSIGKMRALAKNFTPA